MLYSNKNRKDWEKVNKLPSLQNQSKPLRLQDRPGKQKNFEVIQEIYKPATKTNKEASEYVTKAMTEVSTKKKRAPANSNDKFFKKMIDRGILESYLLSRLTKNANLGHASQLKLVKDPDSHC